MKVRSVTTAIAALAIWLAAPAPARAHRLDEFLQATRLSIDSDRVGLEIDLTAGESLASEVFGWIDTNRDGRISGDEGDAYARQMLHAVTLSVDGRPAPVILLDSHYPEFQEMQLGVGVIRLHATASVPATRAGRHSVSYSNTHRADRSVYLVNALVPEDARIQIGEQWRDRAQHGLTLNYDMTVSEAQARTYWLLTAFAMVAFLGAARGLSVNAKHVVHSGDSGNNGGSHTNPLPLEGLPNDVPS